jgi:glutathione S-transferase
LKLYDFPGAPNPRRVRVFAAEKGITLPTITIDLARVENRQPDFLAKNPSGKIPVLELDDGTCIAESVAICRYLEAICPDPNLFGHDPIEVAQIEMHHRHIELEMLSQIGISWVNGPVVAKLAQGRFEQIPAAKQRSDTAVASYYARLDEQLTQAPFVAGARFTIADITAMVSIDFATARVELKPAAKHRALWRWHDSVSNRPSASA